MKRALVMLVAGTLISGIAAWSASAADPAQVALTRLDCGAIQVNDLNQFSDTHAYVGQKKRLTDSCHLTRHGAKLTAFPAAAD